MKRSIVVFAGLALASTAFAYQVTGPVLDVTDSKIVVEKGKEKWEIKRDKETKVSGDLKKGAKVTVQYEMGATSIDVKDGKGADKSKDKDKGDAKKAEKAPAKSK